MALIRNAVIPVVSHERIAFLRLRVPLLAALGQQCVLHSITKNTADPKRLSSGTRRCLLDLRHWDEREILHWSQRRQHRNAEAQRCHIARRARLRKPLQSKSNKQALKY
jgi:hypothetical protein